MSRIGKQPINIPQGVEIILKEDQIIVKGPKGELSQTNSEFIKIDIKDNQCLVNRIDDSKRAKSEHGLFRSLIANMIIGVTEGFSKKLELIGIGYKVRLEGQILILNIGFSHEVQFKVPQGIEINVEGNKININGISKQQVGQVAASIRQLKKPEPYKGKGIRYSNEQIRRKAGKGAKV